MHLLRTKIGSSTALLGLMTTLLAYSLAGCDGANSGMTNESNKPVPFSAQSTISATDIEFVRVVSELNKTGESKQILSVGLRKSSPWSNRLHGFRILSRMSGGKSVVIRDDGRNGDAIASDGIFSGYVSDSCLPTKRPENAGMKVAVSCSFSFVGPGSRCGSFGTCPHRVHRSFFWGLIEYSTDIVVCICVTSCTI